MASTDSQASASDSSQLQQQVTQTTASALQQPLQAAEAPYLQSMYFTPTGALNPTFPTFQSYPLPGFGTGDATWSSAGALDSTTTANFLQNFSQLSGTGQQQSFMTDSVLADGMNPSGYMNSSYLFPSGSADVLGQNASDALASLMPNYNAQYGLGLGIGTDVSVSKGTQGDVGKSEQLAVSTASINGMNEPVEKSLGGLSLSDNPPVTSDIKPSTISTTQSSGPKSWAAIAKQPAKQPQKPKPKPSSSTVASGSAGIGNSQGGFGAGSSSTVGQHHSDMGQLQQSQSQMWGMRGAPSAKGQGQGLGRGWSSQRRVVTSNGPSSTGVNPGVVSGSGTPGSMSGLSSISAPPTQPAVNVPVLEQLRSANQYNPKEFTMNVRNARFFVIKSYSEDDIHRSIKYSIWTSTESGNRRLDSAWKDQQYRGMPMYLLFSVNGSGHFCGVAEMTSGVDYGTDTGVFTQDKWKGKFDVKWIYVKDVPNSQLRHIRLENNENKPITNSRDTQEVPQEKGKQVVKIIHSYKATTSIFDDFGHYEKRQEEDDARKRIRKRDGPSS
jgi:hypothetical protein